MSKRFVGGVLNSIETQIRSPPVSDECTDDVPTPVSQPAGGLATSWRVLGQKMPFPCARPESIPEAAQAFQIEYVDPAVLAAYQSGVFKHFERLIRPLARNAGQVA